ncbi:MAG: FAD-dependent monooxygenase [Phaeodactylibacter sp.]|nr:FAD-dependent monooxygenase [Phaeodactylibacter sp.]MCB9286502.1 FAD-dependent monooxygenase [Lewinellaceae bacterium]
MQDLNILIVGAGVAGLTCAGLLQRKGFKPVIIEKEPEGKFNTSGYMLGLLPLGGRVLTELDAGEEYFARSIQMEKYEIHKEDGSLNKSFSLDFINDDYGSYRGISRRALIEILLGKIDVSSIYYGTTVNTLRQNDNSVEVTFSDNSRQVFDLVIAADGMHSQIRRQMWKKDEYAYFDTNWGGWVAWLDSEPVNSYKEYWGASSFMGLYPVKNQTGVFLGGPNEVAHEKGLHQFVWEIQSQIRPEYPELHSALEAFLKMEKPYFWEFHDCKTENWQKGNIILLGDSAAGFLPTAGVGASMAMDSASALADELSRTDKNHLDYGLHLYVKRQKSRVENAQKDSRNLARIMFVKSKVIAAVRDYALRFYSLKQLASNINRTMEGA